MSPAARRLSRPVKVGTIILGAGNPVRVQSMTNTPTTDVKETLAQISRLSAAGCELVRVAVSNRAEIASFGDIRERTDLPLVADIQNNHRLALECLRLGADKVRINPGNIGPPPNFLAVIEKAAALGKAVRIGINSGSLREDILSRHGGSTPAAMMESLREALAAAASVGFDRIVVSMKSSGVLPTIEAYRLAAAETDFPLHLGITEAGGLLRGSVKSAVGLGILLHEGIGDTIRISLSAQPEAEVRVGYDILRSLGMRRRGPDIISCPTCSRCQIDILSMVEDVEERLQFEEGFFTVAVMGCYVNGPGEARDADVGLAGGSGKAAIFRKGRVVREVPESECVDALMDEIRSMRAGSDQGGGW